VVVIPTVIVTTIPSTYDEPSPPETIIGMTYVSSVSY
jgi:hypothetical protein